MEALPLLAVLELKILAQSEILLWKLELEESMWLKVYPHVIPGGEEDNHLS